MLKLLQAHRNAYMREWYYAHPYTWRECWNHSFIGNIHMWWLLRYKAEMIDTPLWEYLKVPMYGRHGYKAWLDEFHPSVDDFEQDKYVCKYCDEDLTGIEELDLDCNLAMCVPHDEFGDPIY